MRSCYKFILSSAIIMTSLWLSIPVMAGQSEIFIGEVGKMPIFPKNKPVNYLAKCLANPEHNIDCAIANDSQRDGGLESSVTKTLETVTIDICPDQPKGLCVNGKTSSAKSLRALNMKILFDYDKTSLQAGEHKKLVQLAKALNDPLNKQNRFAIIGHTDSKGTTSYNCGLSAGRAKTVRDVLTGLGISASSLLAYGAGEYLLRNKNNGSAAKNRRVGFAPLQGVGSEIIGKIGQLCQ